MTQENKTKEPKQEVMEAAVVEEVAVTEPVEENLLVKRIDETTIMIEEQTYEIVLNYREAFDAERLSERYSEILSKYDYIVADWGFEQLRLKGFYDDKNRKVSQDQRISTLQDYLYEYCNFGCAYFVLQRVGEVKKEKSFKPKRSRNRPTHSNPKAVTTKPEAKSQKNKTTKPNNTAQKAPKKNFVTKDVTQPKQVQVVQKQKQEPKAKIKTVEEKNGQRHFNIRRNDVEQVKNKS